MLAEIICDTVRETHSYFLNMKRWDQSDLTLRNHVLFEVSGKNMYFSQCKPMFAQNFIIKCCVSSKDRFLRSTEVTRRVMLHQKNPNGSPKVSSSSQLLLINFKKRVWVWTFATCFIPNFKFPPLLSRKRFKACVLQVFWTNWGFSKCLKWHWSYPCKTKNLIISGKNLNFFKRFQDFIESTPH